MASCGDCATSTAMGTNGVTHSYRRVCGAHRSTSLDTVIVNAANAAITAASDRSPASRG
jgi:hypothetical protein